MTIQNRLTSCIQEKRSELLTVFFTAGYPEIEDTPTIAVELAKNGVDILEIGFPYSDSLVDGPTIQRTNEVALRNGMTLEKYFTQVGEARLQTEIPFIYMGCLNPLLQFGVERFLDSCVESGIDGLIVPDLPPEEFDSQYRSAFEERNLSMIFLITARTPDDRINKYDKMSRGFLYAVSSEATTGGKLSADAVKGDYFQRLGSLRTDNPILIGFGISDQESFRLSCEVSAGAVIGSAFLRALEGDGEIPEKVQKFVNSVRQ